jgi:hypothetical protein
VPADDVRGGVVRAVVDDDDRHGGHRHAEQAVQAGVDHQLLVEARHDEDEEQVVGADGRARLPGAATVALVPGQGDRPIGQEGEDG